MSGNESSDLRRTRRQSAFEKFRLNWVFPPSKARTGSIRISTAFLKEEYALGVAAAPASCRPGCRRRRPSPGLDCHTGSCWSMVSGNGDAGDTAAFGFGVETVDEALTDPEPFWVISKTESGARMRFFTALNTALFTDGLLIRVKPGALLEKPIHIIHAYYGRA
jgi:Fe-S cluster assembly protein SufD